MFCPRRSMVSCAVVALTLVGGQAAAKNAEGWWSLQPLNKPVVPLVQSERAANPIDSFLLERLQQAGLRYSPEADGRTLIRRLYFDLLGLPPSPETVQDFINDPSPTAYERMVDQLLDRPEFGERWARHWLDVVHYGDTHGYDKDQPRPNAWPYRDYVIRAFNADRPYSQFVQEQIAGDVFRPDTRDGIEALGFISAGPWDFIGHVEISESKVDGKIARHLDRDDMVANTMNTFNSLTVQCAQCHDHKFDPIPAEDYYKLQAVFAAVDRTNKEYYDRPELTRQRAKFREKQRALERAKGAFKDDQASPEWQVLTNDLAGLQQELAAMPKPSVAFVGAVHHGEGAFRGTGPDDGKPRLISLLARGDVRKPGREVRPGALSAIHELNANFPLAANAGEGDRRKALALWLTAPENPLTWRSIVNRVWQYHFGQGIVATPNDFGRMGSLPSHPELLDWLAVEFRDGGQSLKRLHKLILMSAAYRQVSGVTSETARAGEVDSDNRLLWRANRRKLEAEAVRDSILCVSRQLNDRMFGPGYQDFVVEKPEHSPHYLYEKFDPDDVRARRRSIYRFIVRSQQQPFMTTLDCADPSMLVPRRNESLSALQALTLLNNSFVLKMADEFARELACISPDLEVQVAQGFQLALARPPGDAERRELTDFAKMNGMANTCRLLFNLSEFNFVD